MKKEPPAIKVIFDKAGCKWSEANDTLPPDKECRRVKAWLHEADRLEYLLLFAVHHLGSPASQQDGQDAWGQFYLKRLDKVIKSYDPAKGIRFWGYLLFCFKRFCWDEGKKLRKREQRQSALDRAKETEEGELIMLELVDQGLSPQKSAEQKAFLRDLSKCLNGLRNLKHRNLFILCEIREYSYKEAANILKVLEGNVGKWLCRAKKKLGDCLTEKGWNQ